MKFNPYLVSLATASCLSLLFSCTSDIELPPPPGDFSEQGGGSSSSGNCLGSECHYGSSSSIVIGSSSSGGGSSSSSSGGSSSNACVTWTEWNVTTPATCKAGGVKTRTCTSDASKEEIQPITQLEWGEWTIITPATSTTLAKGKRTCPNGDEDVKDDLKICGTNPDNIFTPEEQFCQEVTNKVLELCGGTQPYAATKFCQSGTNEVKPLCGTVTYTATQGCCKGGVYNLTREHYGKMKAQFCDERDGKTYVYVAIPEDGTGQIWMAENLNYNVSGSKCGIGGISGNNALSNENTPICDTYGRLYNWSTAMNIDAKFNNEKWGGSDVNHQGVCPAGWHIPNDAELGRLYRYADGTNGSSSHYMSATAGKYLKAESGWNNGSSGEDKYGFAALPGGYGSLLGYLYYVGDQGFWWSINEHEDYDKLAYKWFMTATYESLASYSTQGKSDLISVRCLKD